MAKKIIWTPRAEISFDTIVAYLDEHWSETEIINFIRKTDLVVSHISRFPYAYRHAGNEDVREALITRHNLLLYRITADTIYLLYFWDTRKNPLKKPI